MKKEALKLENILNDLASVAENKYSHCGQWFLGGAVAWVALAVFIGIYFKSIYGYANSLLVKTYR